MFGPLARASAALPGLAGLWTTAQKVCVATFANGTVPSLAVLIWNPLRVFFFSLPPPIVCFSIALPLIFCAAYAVPARATNSATSATTIAGDGRLLQSLLIVRSLPWTRPVIRPTPLTRESGNEALEGADVGHGGAVAREDQRGVELGELADRAAVLGRVGGEVFGWLGEAGPQGDVSDVADHVAADRDPVGVAEEDHLAGGVAGGVDDPEPRHLVALLQHPVDLAERARPELPEELGRRLGAGGDGAPSLHRVDVVRVAGERDAARLADDFRAALVVGVDVGQRDFGDLTSLELGEDPHLVPAAAGVDQHVLGQVDVDQRPREFLQPPDAGGQVLQWEIPRPSRGSPLCWASSSRRAICRSPSTRAGCPAGRGSIRRRMRLRICSEKCGVTGPARARMSSAVISFACPSSSGFSDSLIRRRRSASVPPTRSLPL